MSKYVDVVYDPLASMLENEGNRVAAEASYYLMFSISPVLFLVFVALSSLSASPLEPSWVEQISGIVSAYVPQPTYEMLSDQLQQIMEHSSGRNVFLAGLVFLWTFTNVFTCYMDAISRAYEIPDNRPYLHVLGVSLGLALASGMMLLLTTVTFVLLPLVFEGLNRLTPFQGPMALLHLARYTGTFLLIIPSIAILYKFGPDGTRGRAHSVWPGAALAAVLWLLATHLFGIYLAFSEAYQVLTGALGGVMILLLWMYLSSLAIVFGAEFNANVGGRP